MCFGPRMEARREILLPVSYVEGDVRFGWKGGLMRECKRVWTYCFDVLASNRSFGRHCRMTLVFSNVVANIFGRMECSDIQQVGKGLLEAFRPE